MTTVQYRGYSIIQVAPCKWEYFDPETRLTHRHTSLEDAKAEIREGTKLTPTKPMKPDIYTQARHIAELLRAAVQADSQAPTVLSAELHDILRGMGWISGDEAEEIGSERDSLAAEVESLESEIDELKGDVNTLEADLKERNKECEEQETQIYNLEDRITELEEILKSRPDR